MTLLEPDGILTPVRIRGKRRQHEKPSQSDSNETVSDQIKHDALGKSDSSVPQDVSTIVKKRSRLGHTRRRKEASHLERLPIELLQKIFLYSLNPNFPLASPGLASALMADHVFMSLCRIAFVNCSAEDLSLTELRNALLTRREMTLERWHEVDCERCAIWNEVVNPGCAHPLLYAAEAFPLPADTRVPPRLLRPPWTTDNVKLLDLLVRRGATINWTLTTSGETAMEGLRSAIRETHIQVVRILTEPTMRIRLTPDLVIFAADHANGNSAILRLLWKRAENRYGSRVMPTDEILAGWVARLRCADGDTCQGHRCCY